MLIENPLSAWSMMAEGSKVTEGNSLCLFGCAAPQCQVNHSAKKKPKDYCMQNWAATENILASTGKSEMYTKKKQLWIKVFVIYNK